MADSLRRSKSEPPPFAPTPTEPELRLPPADALTERLVLGSVLVNPDVIDSVLTLDPSCFSTEAFRRIHARMAEMQAAGTPIDRLTLANELRRQGQLESVGGVTALLSLEEGMPAIPSVDAYLKILREFANRRRLIALGTRMTEAAYSGEQTPVEIAGDAAKTWQEIESNSGQNDDGGQSPRQIAEAFEGGIDALLNPTMRRRGLPTGFAKLDEVTGGLHAGEVIIIAARPSHGKTAFSLNIAQHLVTNPKQKRRVAFFSLEMSKESLMTRMLCSTARVDQMKFRAGYLNAEERRKLQIALADLTEDDLMTIYDISGISMPEISKRVRRLSNERGLDLVVVDYIGLMGSVGKIENRNQQMGLISRQFKGLAGELGIPIIVLSQLNRDVEKRSGGSFRPMLSDLRDSGEIEQDADLVMFIFREEMYKRDREDLRGVAEIIISKQRNGPLAVVPLRFLHAFTKFENRADDLPEE